MSDGKACLPFWEGFCVVDLQTQTTSVEVALAPDRAAICGRCQRPCLHVHEHHTRVIRDLPMLGRAVRLRVTLRRVACPDCGTRMEAVSWLDRDRSAAVR